MDKKSLVYKGHGDNVCIGDTTLRIMPSGEFIIVFMTGGAVEPIRDNHIRICRSSDQGQTWSEPEVVQQFDNYACLPSEVLVDDGIITVFYQRHIGNFDYWTNWTVRSRDQGRTWEAPEPFTPWPRYGFVRNRIIRRDGTWVFPLESFEDGIHERQLLLEAFRTPYNGVLLTADKGKTWQVSKLIQGAAYWAENNIVELSDGTIVMLCRTDDRCGYLLRADSTDGGLTWSPFRNSGIPNPGSKFRLFKLRDGRIALIHNPHPVHRHPLALWVSDDDMKSWKYQRVLCDFPGQLQYPDGQLDAEEKYIHFAFDYNRHDLIYWAAEIPE